MKSYFLILLILLVIPLVFAQELPQENQTNQTQENPEDGKTIDIPPKDIIIGGSSGSASDEEHCSVTNISGAFIPTQIVFPDDKTFPKLNFFKKLSDNSYRSDLDMVAGKPSLLFGPRSSELRNARIGIIGTATGTQPIPAGIRFKLLQEGSETLIYQESLGEIPCEKVFEKILQLDRGLPKYPDYFIFEKGPYEIRAEIFREDNNEIIGDITVEGNAVRTRDLKISFVPFFVREKSDDPIPKETLREAVMVAERIARETNSRMTNIYPFKPGAVTVQTKGSVEYIYDLDKIVEKEIQKDLDMNSNFRNITEDIERRIRKYHNNRRRHYEKEFLKSDIVDKVKTQKWIAGADTDKIVLIMDEESNRKIFAEDWLLSLGAGDPPGIAMDEKIVVLNSNKEHALLRVIIVLHEIAHTANYLWSDVKMLEQCGLEYHKNIERNVADGYEVIVDGSRNDEPVWRYSITKSIMSAGSDMDLCTYQNLLNYLRVEEEDSDKKVGFSGFQDSRNILVRGEISKDLEGKFYSSYLLEGSQDIKEGDGDWKLSVVTDSRRKNYTFEPQWDIHADTSNGTIDIERNVISFGYRIPFSESIKKIELIGPNGILDMLEISENLPEIEIKSAKIIGDNFVLSWEGTDMDGDNLLYSVFYSTDNENWEPRIFETEETAGEIEIDTEFKNHWFKVVATDGSLSSEDIIHLGVNVEKTESYTIFYILLSLLVIIVGIVALKIRK